jgi:hypothetical protein
LFLCLSLGFLSASKSFVKNFGYKYMAERTQVSQAITEYFNSFMVSKGPIANASKDPMAAATDS